MHQCVFYEAQPTTLVTVNPESRIKTLSGIPTRGPLSLSRTYAFIMHVIKVLHQCSEKWEKVLGDDCDIEML